MKSHILRLSAVLAFIAITGCAPMIHHGFAYDDHSLPREKVGVLLGYYGIPALLITDVDGRKFSITLSQPHPVKIYVLPGERTVQFDYLWADGMYRYTAKGKLKINVEPGHAYGIDVSGTGGEIQYSAKDFGSNFDIDGYTGRNY